MRRQRIALLFSGAALAALAVAWWALRGTSVDAVEVRIDPLVCTVQFSARVATVSRMEVGSTVTGRVAQMLVRLESDELRAALERTVASERQAQTRLDGIRTSGRLAAQAAQAQAQADATAHAARAEMDRMQQLVAQGLVSASRVDDARRALDVAQAQLAAARAGALAARAKLEQTVLRAPADARVLLRGAEPGQIV